jgi:hypothetical protein
MATLLVSNVHAVPSDAGGEATAVTVSLACTTLPHARAAP